MKFLFKLINKTRIKEALAYYHDSIGSTKRFKSLNDVELLLKLNSYEPEHFLSIELKRGLMYFFAHQSMDLFVNMDLEYNTAFHMYDKQDPTLRNIFIYLYCNYDNDSNLTHPMYFDNELSAINSTMKRIWSFVKNTNLNKIDQEDRDEFKDIKFEMYILIHAYNTCDYSFNSTSTIHSKIKDVLLVYNRMLLEKIY